MKCILLLISICLLGISPNIAAETPSSLLNSQITIASYQVSDTQTEITLSNGMAVTYKDTDLFVKPYGWRAGDRVNLDYNSGLFSKNYYLDNASFQGRVPLATMGRAQIYNVIQGLRTSKRRKSVTITLNDGTDWHVGSWSAGWLDKWQVGDQVCLSVFPFKLGRATHWILNLDRSTNGTLPISVRARLRGPKTTLEASVDVNQRSATSWAKTIANLFVSSDGHSIMALTNGSLWGCATKVDWNIGDRVGCRTFDKEYQDGRSKWSRY